MARPTKPYRQGDGWRFQYKGLRHYRSTEPECWLLLAELQAAERGANGGASPAADPDPKIITHLIAAWGAERVDRTGKPPKFGLAMLEDFRRFAGPTVLAELPADILFRYHTHLRTRLTRGVRGKPHPLGAESQRKAIAYASALLGWAHRRGLIATRPDAPSVKPPPFRPHALSKPELDSLLAGLAANGKGKYVLRLVRFLLETGMRPGEARNLEWTEVDLGRRVVTIPTHKTLGRQARPRIKTVPLSDLALELLTTLPYRDGFVFRSALGKPYSARGLETILHRHGVGVYQLRHCWAQDQADRGTPPHIIASIMGHTSSEMQKHYCRVSDVALHNAVAGNGLGTITPPADARP
jgi:integrase